MENSSNKKLNKNKKPTKEIMSKSVKNGRRPEQDFCEVYIYIFVASYIT
jgi:hypothetical protein